MIQLATIGTSWITEQFIEAIQKNGNYHLRSVYSRNKSNAEKFIDIYEGDYATDNLEDFWNDKTLEVVYIASPNSLHYDQALEAVKAKKHLIIEKPIFSNLEQWEEIFTLAKENDLYIFEAARHIHTKNYQFLKNLVQTKRENSRSPFLGANLNIGQYSSRYDKYNEALRNNRNIPNVFNPEFSGGVLMDLGVYPIYVAVDLFGKPDSLKYKSIKGPNKVDLYGHVYFDYGSFMISIFISKAVHSTLQNEFYFDNETVRVPSITGIDKVEIITSEQEKVMSLNYNVNNPLFDEVGVFAEIIQMNDSATEEKYQELKQLSRDVTEVMEQLKK